MPRSLFGCWIVRIGRMLANRFDPIALTTVQLAVVARRSRSRSSLVDGLGHARPAACSLAVVFTGDRLLGGRVHASQLWGQRTIEPARAALILLLEPVVAGVVGYAVGERLGAAGLPRRGA